MRIRLIVEVVQNSIAGIIEIQYLIDALLLVNLTTFCQLEFLDHNCSENCKVFSNIFRNFGKLEAQKPRMTDIFFETPAYSQGEKFSTRIVEKEPVGLKFELGTEFSANRQKKSKTEAKLQKLRLRRE